MSAVENINIIDLVQEKGGCEQSKYPEKRMKAVNNLNAVKRIRTKDLINLSKEDISTNTVFPLCVIFFFGKNILTFDDRSSAFFCFCFVVTILSTLLLREAWLLTGSVVFVRDFSQELLCLFEISRQNCSVCCLNRQDGIMCLISLYVDFQQT